MALAASQSLAQGQATVVAQNSTAVPTLAPLRVQGQAPEAGLPQGATVLQREALDERGIDNWEDFSKRGEPGVNFNRNNHSINIRGMDQDRVVTRVDGIRVPWLNDGARGEKGGLDSLNFNSLSSIDLVRGAGATQSGSLVGYLDLHTLLPDDLLDAGQDLGALIKSGYDSADRSWGADAALAGRMGQGSSWLLQAGQRKGHELRNMGEVGGYGATREKANPENYTQRNVMLKLQHDWNEEHRLSLSGEFFRRDRDIDNQRQQGNPTFALGENSTFSQNQRERVALAYSYQAIAPQSALSTAGLSVFWQRSSLESTQDAFRTSAPLGGFGRTNSVQESDIGVIANGAGYIVSDVVTQHWQTGLEWVGNRNLQASTGYDTCTSITSRRPPCSMLHTNQADVPTVKGSQWALWAQDEISWDQGKYALTPAVRFDAYRQRPQAEGDYTSNPNAAVTTLGSSSGQRVSPSLLASYRPQEALMFYAKYGYGYKAPNAAELYMNYGAPGTYLRVGNPALKAEISRGWELGAEVGNYDRGARLSVFDNRYRDFIDQDVTLTANSPEWNPAWTGLYPMGVSGFVNRSRVRIYGAELAGHWGINQNWYTRGSLAWSHGRDQDTGRYLNSVAPLKAVVALGYRANQWGAEAITTLAKRRSHVEYPQATPEVSTPDFQAPGYGLLDLTGWWTPPAVKGVRLQAGLYNVFDKKYWNALDVPRSSGRDVAPIDSYTQSGRSVRLTLSYQY
ncbi:MAG: TonB-dependent hemoglobin/transferrin/lactoferrin family receptor [Burkholderiaceae bacterium]|nr:TonB-dependent hemoglobin/transferrin/lactoferrin family receptor [Burkholderiaceae bacterium]